MLGVLANLLVFTGSPGPSLIIFSFKVIDSMITIGHLEAPKGRPNADKRGVSLQVDVASLLLIFYSDRGLAADDFPSVPHSGKSERECSGHTSREHAPVGPASI